MKKILLTILIIIFCFADNTQIHKSNSVTTTNILNKNINFYTEGKGNVVFYDITPTLMNNQLKNSLIIKGKNFTSHKASISPYSGSNKEIIKQISSIDINISIQNLFIKDNLVFVANDREGLQIIDISNPSLPIIVGSIDTYSANGVYIKDNLAFIADGSEGLKIVDITNLSSPILLSSIETGTKAYYIYVKDNLAFIADNSYEGLKIVDVTNPSSPMLLSSINRSYVYYTRTIYMKDNLAFIADYKGLKIVDVSNPSLPTLVGSIDTYSANGIYIKDNLAFVADGSEGLKIVDITNPSSPTLVGSLKTDSARKIYIKGNLIFITDGSNNLKIIDISNPILPTLLNSIEVNDAKGIYIENNLVFVIDDNTTNLRIYELNYFDKLNLNFIKKNFDYYIIDNNLDINSNLKKVAIKNNMLYEIIENSIYKVDVNLKDENISLKNKVLTFNTNLNNLFIKDNIAFIIKDNEYIKIVDITNPSSPTLVSSINTDFSIKNLFVKDNLVFVADGTTLKIIDITNLSSPTILSSINIYSAYEVYVKYNLAFIAEGTRGLKIIDVSNPSSPTILSSINIYSAYEVYVKDNLAFIAEGFEGLKIMDISNLSSPTLLSSIDTFNALGVYVKDNLAFVNDGSLGLKIIDISNLSSPTILSSIKTNEQAYYIYTKDNLVFVANSYKGLDIIDISNPSSPTFLNSIDTNHKIQNLYIKDNLIFFIDNSGAGLKIIDISDLSFPKNIFDLNSNIKLFGNYFGAQPKQIKIVGEYLYLINDFFYIFKIDNGNLKYISSYETYDAQSFQIKDDLAFIADGSKGLKIMDITNPSSPTILSSIDTYGANGVYIKDNLVFVADGFKGLKIIDITNPSLPTILSSMYISYNNDYFSSNYIYVKNNLVFTINSSKGLKITDITNLSFPKSIDTLNLQTSVGNELYNIGVFEDRVIIDSKFGVIDIKIPLILEPTSITDTDITFELPKYYEKSGKYDITIFNPENQKEDYLKIYSAFKLEDEKILNSIQNINSLELKVVGEAKEFYKVGDTIELMAILKSSDGTFEDMFTKLKVDEYKLSVSDESKALIIGGKIIEFKNSGEVTVKLQTKTQEGLLKFKLVDENGTFEKNENQLDMIIVVGRDSEEKKLEKAFTKNGNDLYLFALTLTNAENIKYFNSISKEQIIADINEEFGKDNVILNETVNFDNIKDAIENMPYSTTPLLIHILGHGSTDLGGKVMLEEGYLPAEGLKIVLNDYQNKTNREVIIVVDACYSGAFAQTLESKEFKRLIITSVNADETAIMAPLDGTSYSKYLKEYFGLGNTMGISFDESSKIYRNLVNQSLSPTIKGDEILQNFKVPNPKISSGLNEVFLNYSGKDGKIEKDIGESEDLFVKIKLSEFERKTLIDNAIYAKIISPQEIDLNVGEFEIPTIEIEKVILKEVESDSESVTYKSNYSFDKDGIYSIAFAIENNMQNTIETKPIKIEVGKENKDIATLTIEEKINESDNFILKRGWNLVTSPIKEGIEVNELNITSIWSYKNGKWENSIDKIEPYRGYFINADTNQSYKFGGINYKINFDNLENGWNLVGSGDRVYKYEFEGVDKVFSYDENWTSGESEYFHYLEKAKGVWVKK